MIDGEAFCLPFFVAFFCVSYLHTIQHRRHSLQYTAAGLGQQRYLYYEDPLWFVEPGDCKGDNLYYKKGFADTLLIFIWICILRVYYSAINNTKQSHFKIFLKYQKTA